MHQYELSLEKYWVTQSGYFRLSTTLALGTSIKYGKLLFCHGVLEGNIYKEISMIEYNTRKVYYCLNNSFTSNFGRPDLNLPPITIDDRPSPHKWYRCTPDMLPATIYVAPEISVSTFITPSDSAQVVPLISDDNTYHTTREILGRGTEKIGYWSRHHDGKIASKSWFYCSACF